jgi:excisionase family DNA binding protein
MTLNSQAAPCGESNTDGASEILTVEQAADLLHLTAPTVRQMASRALLPGRRIGKLWRFSRKKLVAFIKEGNPTCLSTNGAAPRITGVDSRSVVEGFSNLPARTTGRPPKSMNTDFRAASGEKRN